MKPTMNRYEMFDFIVHSHEKSEELKLQEEYTKELTKPIYKELKSFCDEYYKRWVKMEKNAEADKSFIYQHLAHTISHFVIDNILEDMKNDCIRS